MKGPSSNIESVVWAASFSVRPIASILRLPDHTGLNIPYLAITLPQKDHLKILFMLSTDSAEIV